jgi:hypothetical protein
MGVSTAAQVIAGIVVPAGEDWILTDFAAHRGSTFSTATVLTLVDDSTSLGTIALTSSGGNVSGSTRIAAAGGEYTGTVAASGSSLTVTIANGNSSVAASSAITAWVYGFQRWLDTSTLGAGPGS